MARAAVYTAAGGRADSGALLRRALEHWCRGRGRAVPDLTVARPPWGKPHLPAAPDIQFSVTHSGAFWACAVADIPVGLDLQQIQPAQGQKIAHRFFHPQEAAYLDARPEEFFPVWSAKESFVKWSGQGIDEGFSRFSVTDGAALRPPEAGLAFQFLSAPEGYVLCLCCAEGAEVVRLPLPDENE